jgi:predicted O-linked N-acetylglucosamine transferase (SPINDLY family)
MSQEGNSSDPISQKALKFFEKGSSLQSSGDHKKAVNAFKEAILIQPDFVEAHNNLGLAYLALSDAPKAELSFLEAHKIDPKNSIILNNLGVACRIQVKLDEAISFHKQAIDSNPNYKEAHNNLGAALSSSGKAEQAADSYKKAIKIDPKYAEAHNNLGGLLTKQGKLDMAIKEIETAIQIKPKYGQAYCNLGNALKDMGKIGEAALAYGNALDANPSDSISYSNFLFCNHYRPGISLEKINKMHSEWAKTYCDDLPKFNNYPNIQLVPKKTLSIGLVSPDFKSHPVGYFLSSFLDKLDKDKVKIYCYSDLMRGDGDKITAGIKNSADSWNEVSGFSHLSLGKKIQEDGIDILFDLVGHTANNRLFTFAQRPSPVQVTWAGYVGTTGMKAMNWIFADKFQILENHENFYVEKVYRLPNDYICYAPPQYAPECGPLPAKKNKFISFCSYNNPAKVNDPLLETWGKILQKVTKSKLFLKYRAFDDAYNQTRVLDCFQKYGIEKERVIFWGNSTHEDTLKAYTQMDIALDTHPYSGGLTTCEALWMGVPVITKPGDTFASRHSLTHLANVGLTETVAETWEDYINIAQNLSGDIQSLEKIRLDLRKKMQQSPLCDGEKFARTFENACQDIWKKSLTKA